MYISFIKIAGDRMQNIINTVKDLKKQKTWILVILNIITLNVYGAHYIYIQSRKLNKILEDDMKISDLLQGTILLSAYIVLVGTILAYINNSALFDYIANLASLVLTISLIVWSFKIRNRMNKILNLQKSDSNWFHGFWTFLLPPYYFNYKINCLTEQVNENDTNILE